MSRRALDVLLAMPEQARFVRGMVAWIGFKQLPFPYDRAERAAGETKYPLSKMLRFAFDALTGFSSAPLKLASHAGLLLSLSSILIILYIGYAFVTGQNIQGWTSLMLVVVVLGAVQMFVLAMMGEYIGRLYSQAKNRPLYIVQDIAGARARRARRPRSGAGGSHRPQRQPGRQRHPADQPRFLSEHRFQRALSGAGGSVSSPSSLPVSLPPSRAATATGNSRLLR
jgi:hypothetical protein